MSFWEPPTLALTEGKEIKRRSLWPRGHLIVQRHRPDCWTAGPVVVALRYLGVQNAKREGERKSSDDDYDLRNHGSPLESSSHVPCIAGIQPLSVMAVTDLAKARKVCGYRTFGRSGHIKSQRSIMLCASRLGQSPLSCSFHFIMFALRPYFSISLRTL
jgi:hypothetical protein